MFSAKRPVTPFSQDNAPAFPQSSMPGGALPVPYNPRLAPVVQEDFPGRESITLETGSLPGSNGMVGHPLHGSTLVRTPIVIKSEMKRSAPLPPRSREARKRHSKRLWILGMLVLVLTTAVTLLDFTPQGREITSRFSPNQLSSGGSVIANKQNIGTVQAQATANWMYQMDGYDPYGNGQVSVSDGANSLDWPYGQCTYWANYRYHQLTGFWVQWTGNADQWFLGAQQAGWDYGQTPPSDVPSIIVLMQYVQGAGWLGHVAVVESISGNVVHTSNMNWGYLGYTHVEDVDFTLGPGVYFVWHKPKN